MTIIIDDISELAGILTEVQRDIEGADHTLMLTEEIPILEAMHAEYFASEVDPNGVPWVELAESTIQAKGHDRILFETGVMGDSLKGETGESIRDIRSEPGDHALSYGSSDKKIAFHQFWTRRMPQRQPVGVVSGYVEEMAERVADSVVRAAKGE